MRILFINKFLYPKGGSESYMFGLADLLRNYGADVGFWGMADEKNTVVDEYGFLAPNVDYHSSSFGIKKCLETIYSKQNRLRLLKHLEKFAPDIVHLHNYNFQLTPSILSAIRASGIPVVQTIHDSQMCCPAHRLYNLRRKAACSDCVRGDFWHCAVSRCFEGSLAKSVLGAAESYYYHSKNFYDRNIDAYISPSEFMAKKLQFLLRKKINVVPNFTRDSGSAGRVSPGDHALYFGRISYGKGILEACDLFSRARLKLRIIGLGPQQELIPRSPYIEYIGPKYGEELFREISGAKYVIQPSIEPENCPMSVIESFMCSTPVVASPQGGTTEMIEDGVNGFLFDFNDRPQLGRLCRLFQTDTEITNMRMACRQSYLDKYSPTAHLKQIKNIYDELACVPNCSMYA